MTLISLTTKVTGSDTYAERKVLASDINYIKGALQTGTYDIAPDNIAMEGTNIGFNSGDMGVKYDTSSNKMQVSHDGTTWSEITTGSSLITITAGEALSARELVYIDSADGKAYKCDADNPDKIDWIGCCVANIALNATGDCYPDSSTFGGFTALTTGSWYQVGSTAGAIALGDDDFLKVGVAINTTTIKLIKVAISDMTKGLFLTNAKQNVNGFINTLIVSGGAYVTSNNLFNDGENYVDMFNASCGCLNTLCVVTCACTASFTGYGYRAELCCGYDDFASYDVNKWCTCGTWHAVSSSLLHVRAVIADAADTCQLFCAEPTCYTYGAYAALFITGGCSFMSGCSTCTGSSGGELIICWGGQSVYDWSTNVGCCCIIPDTFIEMCQISGCCYDVYHNGVCQCQITKSSAVFQIYSEVHQCQVIGKCMYLQYDIDYVTHCGLTCTGYLDTCLFAKNNDSLMVVPSSYSGNLICTELYDSSSALITGSENKLGLIYNGDCNSVFARFCLGACCVCDRIKGWGAIW